MKKADFRWIARRRDEIGISQDDLTRTLQIDGFSISRSAVANWEQGRNGPKMNDITLIAAISDALHMPLREFLLQSGFDLDDEHSAEAEMAAHIIDRLPPNDRRMAIKILESILQRPDRASV